MDDTPNLALPYIMAAQAQKHVTHNEAIRALDALVQLAVLDRDLSAPPGSPADGARYIVGPSPAGAWAGQAGSIAAWQDGAWAFYAPLEGWLAWVADENVLLCYDGAGWSPAVSLQNVPLLGINATADATNRLALASAASLFNHAGAGHQVKVNKAAAGDTASFLFQTGFSGRAEFGTTGDDDWHVKTSPDGTTWKDSLIVDATTGAPRFPQGLEHAATRAPLAGLVLTPGGDGEVSFWRMNVTHIQNPRTATIDSVSSDVITLASAAARQFFEHDFMSGVAYVRVWNTSKDPDESAWVMASPDFGAGDTQLQVTNAADIAGWSNGETVQIGDPVGVTPNRVIALDISPLLQTVLGEVFRQSGVVAKATLSAAVIGSAIDWTPTGITGSFIPGAIAANTTNVWQGVTMIPCTELSPISNSNLVFIRETSTGNLAIVGMSAIAVLG